MKVLKEDVVLSRKTYRNIAIFTFMAVFCLLIAVVGRPLVNRVLDKQIEKMLVVDSVSAEGYSDWQTNVKDDGLPIWFKFWHFNLTNPDEVIAGTAKPSFEEFGPYCYKEWRSRVNISWSDNGNEVTYWSYKYFTYDQSCSGEGLSEDDPIVTTNLGYVTFLNNLAPPFAQKEYWINELLWTTIAIVFNEPLFITVTAKELMFGHPDPLFTFIHQNISDEFPADLYIQLNLTSEQEALQKTKFTTQQTGKDDIKNIANYLYWNGEEELNCWASNYSNEIVGTDGNYWPPKVHRGDILEAFVDTAYRRAKFIYQKDSSFESIDCYRFILDPTELLNVTSYPDNWQWYSFGYDGMINVTKCALGCPTYLSKAHFLDTDQAVIDAVEGVVPDRSIHDTYADIEPRTGLTMNIYKRLQVNTYIWPVFMSYENITSPGIYMPVTWIEESGYITHDLAVEFRHTVYTVEDSAEVMAWLGAVLAVIFGVLAIGLTVAVVVARKRLAERSEEREGLIERVE